MATRGPTMKRLLREHAELQSNPDQDFIAAPLEEDIFEWHFTLRGPPSTPYSNGIYHGRITLPPTYPLRPPSFRFLTPSGRFQANQEICLSISKHHEESWQPAWGIRTSLTAIRAFMEGEAAGQLGGVDAPKTVRERLARESKSWKCNTCGMTCGEIMTKADDEYRQIHATEKSESKTTAESGKDATPVASNPEKSSEEERATRDAVQQITTRVPSSTSKRAASSTFYAAVLASQSQVLCWLVSLLILGHWSTTSSTLLCTPFT